MRYVDTHELPVIRVRPFNLLGPGLPPTLACGAFVDSIVRLEQADLGGPLRTGRLSSARDFTDIRDVVRAYRLLAERGRAGGVYNVSWAAPSACSIAWTSCSGWRHGTLTPRSIRTSSRRTTCRSRSAAPTGCAPLSAGHPPFRSSDRWPTCSNVADREDVDEGHRIGGRPRHQARPVHDGVPKPLMPIGDMPILDVVLRQLAAAGYDQSPWPSGISPAAHGLLRRRIPLRHPAHVLAEDQPLGTAGPIALVPDLDATFLVIDGDLLTTIDYRAMHDFHVSRETSRPSRRSTGRS